MLNGWTNRLFTEDSIRPYYLTQLIEIKTSLIRRKKLMFYSKA